MSRKEVVIVASRGLALLFSIWALGEVANLPVEAYAFLRYSRYLGQPSADSYWYHHYLIAVGFLVTKIVGFAFLARWLYRGGPEVEQLLFPVSQEHDARSIEKAT